MARSVMPSCAPTATPSRPSWRLKISAVDPVMFPLSTCCRSASMAVISVRALTSPSPGVSTSKASTESRGISPVSRAWE